MQNNNFDYFYNSDDREIPFTFLIRDRERTDCERWVLTSISEQEAKDLYEYLKKHFE